MWINNIRIIFKPFIRCRAAGHVQDERCGAELLGVTGRGLPSRGLGHDGRRGLRPKLGLFRRPDARCSWRRSSSRRSCSRLRPRQFLWWRGRWFHPRCRSSRCLLRRRGARPVEARSRRAARRIRKGGWSSESVVTRGECGDGELPYWPDTPFVLSWTRRLRAHGQTQGRRASLKPANTHAEPMRGACRNGTIKPTSLSFSVAVRNSVTAALSTCACPVFGILLRHRGKKTGSIPSDMGETISRISA